MRFIEILKETWQEMICYNEGLTMCMLVISLLGIVLLMVSYKGFFLTVVCLILGAAVSMVVRFILKFFIIFITLSKQKD